MTTKSDYARVSREWNLRDASGTIMLNPQSVQTFDFLGNEVRTTMKNGEPWFVANDVCKALGIANPWNVTAALDDDEKDLHIMEGGCGTQEMTIISEAGMYSLILRSRKPEAKAFKRWVTHEVLPAIRQTGNYAVNLDSLVKAVTQEVLAKLPAPASEPQYSEATWTVQATAERLTNAGIPITTKNLYLYLTTNFWVEKKGKGKKQRYEPCGIAYSMDWVTYKIAGTLDYNGKHYEKRIALITESGYHQLKRCLSRPNALIGTPDLNDTEA